MELGDHLTTATERVRYSVQDTTINQLAATDPNRVMTTNVSIGGCQNGNIVTTDEYRFPLYRHWTLENSMLHSSYVACRFPVWKADGRDQLKQLLAKIGIKKMQCEQNYNSMIPELREHFYSQLVNNHKMIVVPYKLVNPGITFRVRNSVLYLFYIFLIVMFF
jgi:hypothetical protein